MPEPYPERKIEKFLAWAARNLYFCRHEQFAKGVRNAMRLLSINKGGGEI